MQAAGRLEYQRAEPAGGERPCRAGPLRSGNRPGQPCRTCSWICQARRRAYRRDMRHGAVVALLAVAALLVAAVTPEGQATGDHEPPGFANAGRWRLVTAGGRQPEAWRASWTVADRNAAKNRIWAVHYEGEPAGEVIPQRPDLRAAGEQLRKSLRFASEFRSQSRPGHMGSLVRPCPGQQQRHP